MFKTQPKEFKQLKSKAAESRHLVPVLLQLCQEFNDGSELHLHRIESYKHLNRCYQIIMSNDTFLGEAAAHELLESVDAFSVHFYKLSCLAIDDGEFCYNITFKLHVMWHMCDMAKYLNPKAIWAYNFEDYIGKVAGSAAGCTRGTPIHKVGAKTMDNNRIALFLRLFRAREGRSPFL